MLNEYFWAHENSAGKTWEILTSEDEPREEAEISATCSICHELLIEDWHMGGMWCTTCEIGYYD